MSPNDMSQLFRQGVRGIRARWACDTAPAETTVELWPRRCALYYQAKWEQPLLFRHIMRDLPDHGFDW